MPREQGAHPLPHPLVTLVDELLSEVAVDLLGSDLLAGGQGDVVEVGHLERIDKKNTFGQSRKAAIASTREFFSFEIRFVEKAVPKDLQSGVLKNMI